MIGPGLVLLPLLVLACKKDEEVTYSQFNGPEDALTLEVGTADLLPAVGIDLTSSTEVVLIGTATVDPGGGPIGTEHAVVVEIFDAWQHIVDRVSLRLQSPGRGEDEFEMEQDSADEGVWQLSLVSAGTEDETRTDTLTVRCWDIDGDEDGEATSDDGGSDDGGSSDGGGTDGGADDSGA